ncbi:copper chaperone PCu(A)C [Microtetraspora niveoalba]|uniref:copper chaperone PCu(A)C n=1 Tax=Microtetraspora niveoalba TaxID=46175 RepID=UPI0008305512|nr:copper chaperone PCu(A)C [Microtetraspora niveoalba]
MFLRRIAPAAILITMVAACGSQPAAQPENRAAVQPAAQGTPAPSGHAAISLTDPWVKGTESGMTAAFGTLVNNGDAEVTVVSASSPLSSDVELHEVVESGGKTVMRPKKEGFVIPAHGTHQLEPGGDHIMLMGVTKAVKPGDEIPFTLTFKDGGTLEFTAIGKEFAGGKENYQPGTDHGGSHGGGADGDHADGGAGQEHN